MAVTNEKIRDEILFIILENFEFNGNDYRKQHIKAREIGLHIANIKDEKILSEVITAVTTAKIVNYNETKIKNLILEINNYTSNKTTRTIMKAMVYSVETQYLGFKQIINPEIVKLPDVQYQFKNGDVYSNLEDIISNTVRLYRVARIEKIGKLPTKKEKKEWLKEDINEMLDFKLKKGTTFLDEYIENAEKKLKFLPSKSKTQNNNENKNNTNYFPNIFKGKDDYYIKFFDYLMNELNSKDKTKASIIYHYFKKYDYFSPNLSQDFYKQFLQKNYGIIISKIFQINYKSNDIINITIPNLEIQFKSERKKKKNKEIETN